MLDFGKKRGLPDQDRIFRLDPAAIVPNPDQPRRTFDQAALDALSSSIRAYGVLQPITVRRVPDGYELVAGERRLRAAIQAGLATVPAVVVQADDSRSAQLALAENLLRENLSCFEQAQAIQRLIEAYGLTQQQVADRLGLQQSTVANKLRLLRLSSTARQIVEAGNLTERHARAALRLLGEESQEKALAVMARKGMTVARADQYISDLLMDKPTKKGRRLLRADVRICLNSIEHAISVMRGSGVKALSNRAELADRYEIHIVIPKG